MIPAPFVSVIISSRSDPSDALERTLRAIEAQSFPALEILVCQRATQRTSFLKSATRHFVPRIIEVSNDSDAVLDAALIHARGEYICCLLAGDHLAPTYLEKCLFYAEIGGVDVVSAYEHPADTHPHICVVRKYVLSSNPRYNLRAVLEEQRIDWGRLMALGDFVRGEVREVLAFPIDPPIEGGPWSSSQLPGLTREGCFSYARLVTGWAEQRPTILLAVQDSTAGGAETVVRQLCRHLTGYGFRVLVCATALAIEDQVEAPAWLEDCALGVYQLPQFLDIEYWPGFIAYLVQQHKVTVLCLAGSSYIYNQLTSLRELFPQIAIVDLMLNSAHLAAYFKYNYLIDRIVTEDNGIKKCLLERGEERDRISVIPSGVDLQMNSPCPKLDWRTRRPRSAGDGRFVAAFLGKLSKERSTTDVFLEIAVRLTDATSVEFLVRGAGPMEQDLRRLTSLNGLADRVHFLGLVSSQECLPCCDAVVVCSQPDDRPNIIMQSMAMGIPVVASRVGAIPDMMPPNQEDLLCEPGNADAFATAIRRLAGDPDRYRLSAQIARRHAEEHFSATDSSRAYARLFEELPVKRLPLDRCISSEVVSASLGYKRLWKSTAPLSRMLRVWTLYSPASWFGHLRNALLLLRIRRSGKQKRLLNQFDSEYYRRQFPKGSRWGRWPLLHYVFFGFREGRNPTARFDTRFYLNASPDVRRDGVNPLLHYVMWGEQEGRLTSATSVTFSASRQNHA